MNHFYAVLGCLGLWLTCWIVGATVLAIVALFLGGMR
jgi:hypothetical protein